MLREFQERTAIQRDLVAWARHCGFEPAAHHKLILSKLEDVLAGRIKRLALFLPPGSAKSTYTSVLLPPEFLARFPDRCILATSHSMNLAESFGRRARNLVEQYGKDLGFKLRSDSKAAGEWATNKGGLFFCAGVGTKIAGHRADLGLIDDPVGNREDAESKLIRDKTWDWYIFDFKPRLKPNAAIVLIQTRWHEDDLAGRILLTEGEDWTVVALPLIADSPDDPLGRAVGASLWPEYFTEKHIADAKASPAFVPLYQQKPTPESGDFFKSEWIDPYTYDDESELPTELRYYVGSDHAVSLKEEGDRNCIIPLGVDSSGDLWVLPDVWWPRTANRPDSEQTVHEMLRVCRTYRPLQWWAGREHITASIGPFLALMSREEGIYIPLVETTSSRDKRTRAVPLRDLMSLGRVHFPKFADWWPDARNELLRFDKGTHDDFVDALAEVGRGLETVTGPSKTLDKLLPSGEMEPQRLTLKWLKDSDKRRAAREEWELDHEPIDVEALLAEQD